MAKDDRDLLQQSFCEKGENIRHWVGVVPAILVLVPTVWSIIVKLLYDSFI